MASFLNGANVIVWLPYTLKALQQREWFNLITMQQLQEVFSNWAEMEEWFIWLKSYAIPF